MDYDIIGDVHGQFDKLDALLDALGYRERAGARRHPQRRAIFVGDFIDRGACGVEVVRTVRRMIDAGAALAVMGNHELNAIAWHTPDAEDPGEYLRPHRREPWGLKNRKQHAAFLAQVEHKSELHREIIDWFLTLPLWLELPQLRVVHACWHEPAMAWLSPRLDDRNCLPRHLLPEATKEPTAAEADTSMSTFAAVEFLTKGIEVRLPDGYSFEDKDGIARRDVRVRWWDTEARVAVGKPTFFGHYWMSGLPSLLSSSAVCVDYSAGSGGPLVAYRHEAGAPLSPHNFVSAA